MDWQDYYDRLLKVTEDLIEETIPKLDENDKICSIHHWMSLQNNNTIILSTQKTKKEYLDKERKRTLDKFTPQDSIWGVEKKLHLMNYYMELCGLDLLSAFDTQFQCETLKARNMLEGDSNEFNLKEVQTVIEVQLSLKDNDLIKSDKVSDHLELIFSMDQGDPILNSIITK